MTNLGVAEPMAEALDELGVNLTDLRKIEPDAALGNGGLGRLAACFMDSMATLSIAAHGYGIRYDNGLFRQIIRGGWQQETPEDWLVNGNPWEFVRPEYNYAIGFGGWVEMVEDDTERTRHVWHPAETVEAVAYDTPIVGWRGRHVNTLRLWSARATDPSKLEAFNAGDYVGAFSETVAGGGDLQGSLSQRRDPGRPGIAAQAGIFLHLALRCSISFAATSSNGAMCARSASTPPSSSTTPIRRSAIAELMRILVDLNKVDWDEAWSITQAVFSYTNHTLLPEALETWPVPLMERVLPRHMQIIYLINAAHLDGARRRGFVDTGMLAAHFAHRRARRAAGENGQPRLYRHSHKINGVSALHTDLMRKTCSTASIEIYPGRITNKTNGITVRRWLIECNPGLADIIAEPRRALARTTSASCSGLAALRRRSCFQERVARRKRASKAALAARHRRSAQRARRPGRAVRRAGQAHPRIQASAAQPARNGRPLQRHPREPDAAIRAAGRRSSPARRRPATRRPS